MAEKKDITFRNVKPDEKGLLMYVTPQGNKYWWLKYRFGGKEKLLALEYMMTLPLLKLVRNVTRPENYLPTELIQVSIKKL